MQQVRDEETEQEIDVCRDCECFLRRPGLRLLILIAPSISTSVTYLCRVNMQGNGMKAEKIGNRSKQSLQFSNCSQKWWYSLPLLSDLHPLLQQLLTSSTTRDLLCRQKNGKYDSALSMGTVTGNWVSRKPDFSSFNPTTTLFGQIHH